jgi:hypothetical protein
MVHSGAQVARNIGRIVAALNVRGPGGKRNDLVAICSRVFFFLANASVLGVNSKKKQRGGKRVGTVCTHLPRRL